MSQAFVGPLTVTSALGVQGGSLELGATLGAAPETPFVDFHFGLGAAQDFNVRLINTADNQLDVVTASGGTVLSIQGDKMGIGTSTLGAKLVVNELAGGAEVRVDGLNGTVGLTLGADATTQPWVGTRTNHVLRLLTNNTEQVRVQADGNVGIGTQQASQKLTLGAGNILLPNANAGLHGNLYFGGITDAGQTGLRLFGGLVNGTIPAGFLDVRTTDPTDGFRIRVDTANGGTERMRVTAGGNVGIGTSNPLQKLHVAGSFLQVDGAGGEQVYIGGDGFGNDVQLGSMNPNVQNVAVWNQTTGTRMTLFAADFIKVSDSRETKNVRAISRALAQVTQLRGVIYEKHEQGTPHESRDAGSRIGFIAQEVDAILPEVVFQDSKGRYGISYTSVIPLMVEAIKEQQQTIVCLQKELEVMKGSCLGHVTEVV